MTQVLAKSATKNYDAERLAAAVARAARANRVPAGDAQNLARNVVAKLADWLAGKPEITARELRLATVGAMANYDSETAYLYENEKKIF